MTREEAKKQLLSEIEKDIEKEIKDIEKKWKYLETEFPNGNSVSIACDGAIHLV